MKKILLLTIILVILNGCGANNGLDKQSEVGNAQLNDLDKIMQKYTELEDEIDNLRSELEDYKSNTETLENKIVALENKLMSKYSNPWKDYMILFSYDVIQELDGFNLHDGIITDYDENERLLEVAPVEFIYVNDEDRIRELDIDVENSQRQGDVIVYINENEKVTYRMNDNFKSYVYDWESSGNLVEENIEQLVDLSIENRFIYNFAVINGEVIRMKENYYN